MAKSNWSNKEGAPTEKEFESITTMALDRFWRVVATEFAQGKHGDLSVDMTVRLQRVAKEAVVEWWNNNCKDLI